MDRLSTAFDTSRDPSCDPWWQYLVVATCANLIVAPSTLAPETPVRQPNTIAITAVAGSAPSMNDQRSNSGDTYQRNRRGGASHSTTLLASTFDTLG